MTFLELTHDILKNSDKPLSPSEIWSKAVELELDKKLPDPTQGERLTPWATISARLYVDMKNNEKSSFVKLGKGLFWLKSKGKIQESDWKDNLEFLV